MVCTGCACLHDYVYEPPYAFQIQYDDTIQLILNKHESSFKWSLLIIVFYIFR